MAHTPWEHDAGSFLVYVDECREDLFSGRYYRPFDGGGGRFGGLTHLLMQIEQSLDAEKETQVFRNAAPMVNVRQGLELPLKKGTVANFSVRILFRQNASWQGSVTWLEGKQTRSFRSVLELITLMSGVVAAKRFPPERRRERKIEQAE